MSRQQVDLNKLRTQVLEDQNRGISTVNVDREGGVSFESGPNLSRISPKTFATVLERDRGVVRNKLPRNTREVNYEGTVGWLYDITCELNNKYTLFAYNDGSQYQVLVVFPNIAGQYNVHDAHLFENGSICLQDGGGMPTLESAYAKSVLWCSGFSIFLQTGQFPFSVNNL